MLPLVQDMRSCEQTKDLSVLDHGIMVCQYFDDLYQHLTTNKELQYEWKLPEWLLENKDKILAHLMDIDILRCYLVYHDCGKPYCLEFDEEGKRHFPNHAKVSQEIWLSTCGSSEVANLIGLDMEIHTIKDSQCEEFAKRKQAISLILAGLSEIHANASMFGGIDSTSFKIKWKQINKRGKKVLSLL